MRQLVFFRAYDVRSKLGEDIAHYIGLAFAQHTRKLDELFSGLLFA
jgi:hypothetical protein